MSDYNDKDPYGIGEEPKNLAHCFQAGQKFDDADFSDFEEFQEPKNEGPKPVSIQSAYHVPEDDEHVYVMSTFEKNFKRKKTAMIIFSVITGINLLLPLALLFTEAYWFGMVLGLQFTLIMVAFFIRFFNNPYALGAMSILEELMLAVPIIVGFVAFLFLNYISIIIISAVLLADYISCFLKFRKYCLAIGKCINDRDYTVAQGNIFSKEKRHRRRVNVYYAGIGLGRRQIYFTRIEHKDAYQIMEGQEGLIVLPNIPNAKTQVAVFASLRSFFICSR